MRTRGGVLTDGVPSRCALGTAVVVIAALGAAACSAGPSSEGAKGAQGWAAAAEAWAGAFEASWEVGFSNAARFYAPDAAVDLRGLTGYQGSGAAAIQDSRDTAQATPVWLGGRDSADTLASATSDEAIYVSSDSFVNPVTESVADLAIPMASHFRMSAAGIAAEMFAGSAQAGVTYAGLTRERNDVLAFGYLEAWASGRVDEVTRRYAAGAVLVDSLQEVRATGPEAISALAGQDVTKGGLMSAVLHPAGAPNDGWPDTPDYYANGPYGSSEADRLVLLMDVPDPKGCTRAVASVLWLDEEGLITREERLHRVDRMRECAGSAALPSGWWDEVRLPQAPTVRRTGSVSGPGGIGIAVWNGDERLEPLVAWALQRFADAGLPPPMPTSITFLPEVAGDAWATYGFLTGSDAPDLGVPISRESACARPDCATWTTTAKAAMLHELAHGWVPATGYLRGTPWEASGARAEAFLADHGLTWDNPSQPWSEQGLERAAETIAWGLMDQPYTVDARLGLLTCAELAQDFQTLTYSTPDPRACAEPAHGRRAP